MSTARLTWQNPPDLDDPSVPTRTEIAAALASKPSRWAIVARHDRAVRAAGHVDRINSGREYGAGFEATARIIGNEHRVYARHIG
jgi:hypothetical protein